MVYIAQRKYAGRGLRVFFVCVATVSPDGTKLAYSTDTNGSERFTLQVINIATGDAITTAIENCAGSVVWNADSNGFAYLLVNENWRPDKALYRALINDEDTLLYQEQDDSFFVSLGLSQLKS